MDVPHGKAQTVLGQLDPSSLGCTLTHEHLFHSLDEHVFKVPVPSRIQGSAKFSFSIENLCWLRQYPYCSSENLVFNDDSVRQAVMEEMKFYKKNGGGTIVENSSHGLNTDFNFLKKLAEESNVNIIAGTGFYVASSQPSSVLQKSVEDLASIMKKDILEGASDTKIKCGVIGEVGTSWPLESFEKRVLQASGIVQKELGCPVIIHPGRHKSSPEEIIRIFQEAGGDVHKTVMSHLERTIMDDTSLAEFAELGSYCEFDLFGIEVSFYQLNNEVDMPSDAQRIARLHNLVEEGFEDRIVISHDIHTKHRLMKYGGHGFSHILLNVIPVMLNREYKQETIDKILVKNPQNWLTFK